MQIEFIAQYFVKESADINRDFSLSGVAKMDYYLQVMNELGYKTKVYSTCATNKRGFKKAETTTNNIGQHIFYRSSFGSNNPKIKFMDLIFGRILLFFHLVFSRNCNNKIFIAYHERLYTPIIRYASKLRKLNIIIDVEELYSVAANHPRNKIDKELQSLSINNAGYIFPTHRLREIIKNSLDIDKNPFVICSGNYLTDCKSTNRGGAVVYAGTFETVKGGAIMAIKAAFFLPKSFTMYICGFGTEQEIKNVKQIINQHNINGVGCKIVYRGSVLGNEYTDLLSKCGIGLATQNPNHDLNNTSFPSKILEYLRFGLKVVSSDVGVVREDKCSHLITFFAPYTPESLAEAIIVASNQPIVDTRNALIRFHEEFKNELTSMINKFKCQH